MTRSKSAAAAAFAVAVTAISGASGFVTTITGPIASVAQFYPGMAGTSTLNQFSLQAYPQALCNDGTPAAYYISPGNGSGANTWLVYLEGSMFCWDEVSCSERYQSKKYWMSSSGWNSNMAQGGIFSNDPTESPMYNANLVYVKYCSSDLWSGGGGSEFGYVFHGFDIIVATITSLIQDQGMGSTPGQRLLFGGCSAGAIGAMNALDTVAAMAPSGMQVQGLLDAAALLDLDPANGGWSWSSSLTPMQTLVGEVMQNVMPQLPWSCISAFPGEEWKCIWGQYRLPMLETPYFMVASQFDSFEISYDCDNYGPETPQQYNFVDSFQSGTLSLISAVPAGTAVFSSTCLTHCLTGQDTFYQYTVNGVTPMAALTEWFEGGQNVQVVSSCQGYQCTQQCGINQEGLPCNMGTANCQQFPLPVEDSDEPAGWGMSPPPPTQPQGPPPWVIQWGNKLPAAQQQQEQQQQAQGPGAQPGASQAAGVSMFEPSLSFDQQQNLESTIGSAEGTQQSPSSASSGPSPVSVTPAKTPAGTPSFQSLASFSWLRGGRR